MSSITLKYPFAETELSRNNEKFLELRKKEEEITGKIRNATRLCLSQNHIYSRDITSLSKDDKIKVESCLQGFVEKDANYFGKRQTIFIDLH